MEMKQLSSNWQDKPQVKKGNIGEEIVKADLEKKGYIVYRPETNGAHAFDKLAIKDKQTMLIVDSKAKAERTFYPDTGFNYKHYLEYKAISERYNLDVFIYFVDEKKGNLYGNTLKNLEQPIVLNGKKYPIIELTRSLQNNITIIYFPMCNLATIRQLTEKEKRQLKEQTTKNKRYIFISSSSSSSQSNL